MLVVVRADELTDVLPDLAGRRPSRCRIRRVPHHAHITARVQISCGTKQSGTSHTQTLRNALVSVTRLVLAAHVH